MKMKKSKLFTTSLAIAMAAALVVGGGTFAYLQSSTKDLTNKFNANQVTVDLEENTGNEYEIIPGTTQDKDPKVTVNNTVDAYVFVEITDTTEGLVDYEIADGWTKLEDNVYYREVNGGDTEQEFYVLKGNQVSYDAALENSNMLDAEGNLKEGLELTFQAYAIQKDGFATAADAWKQVPVEVSTVEELTKRIQSGGTVVLAEDLSVDSQSSPNGSGSALGLNITEDTTLILNDRTVTGKNGTVADALFDVKNGATLNVYGNENTNVSSKDMNYTFYAFSNSTLNIYGGNYAGSSGGCVYADGDNITINIYDGFFSCDSYNGKSFVLNQKDDKKAGIEITVYGGTFVNLDPSNNNNENPAENQVAEGYKVVSQQQENGDIWYTVVPEE